jgi:hypothetical protein
MGSLALALIVTLLAPVLVVGQAPSGGAKKSWTVPKTPDGQPDLQGYWTNSTATPLERPKGLGAKEFYTDAELAENQRKQIERDQQALISRGTEKGTDADVHYDFAQFGLDRGQSTMAWSKRTSLIVGPEGTIPAQIPEARKRNADIAAANRGHEADSAQNRPLSARCLILGQESVPMLSGGYNNTLQILQGKGYVVILHEMNHAARVIPTDGRPHPPQNVRLWRGDPVGHWEGNTLVIDNTNFNGRNPFRGSSDKLHVVERFTRVDPDTLLYQFTVEDPATWDKPWTAEVAWSKTDGPIYEFACHEGNYGLANTLSAARVAEREAAQKSGK